MRGSGDGMLSALEPIKQQLNSFWDNLDRNKRRNFIFIIVLVVITIVFTTVLLTKKDYVVLYSGLNDKEAAEIYTKLKESNAQPKMEGTTTILVPKDKEAELRMQMTLEGYPKSGFNYDLYLQGSSFGQTNDEIQKRWIIQLQERLGQSIRFLEGVDDAVVTIAMPKSDSFVLKEDEIPVSASVIILPRQGYEINSQQAKSIEQLMSTSVPGLNKENITIIDNKMNILNLEGESGTQMVANQFIMQQQLEDRIKAEIMSLLEPVFGYGKVKIAVNAKLNFDKRTTESITFEPVMDDSGIIISQELLKEKMSNAPVGGVPGETNNTTQYPEAGMGTDSTSQKDHRKINYEVNEIKEMIEEEQGKLENLSIAVVIDNDQLDQQTINGVRELVSTAMGTDLDRVAVQNWGFNTDIQQDLLDAIKDRSMERPWINLNWIAIIVSSLILITAIALIIRKSKQPIPIEATGEYFPQELVVTEEENIPEIAVSEENTIKTQLNKFAEEQPEEIAQLLRNWLSED